MAASAWPWRSSPLTSGPAGLLRLPLTLSFVLVSALRAAFNFPSELRANWAFQLGEIHPVAEYLSATRKWIVVCAVVPLFVLLAPDGVSSAFRRESRCSTWHMASRSRCCWSS